MIQLVFFHPMWVFRDGADRMDEKGAANFARRSNFPMINILRTNQVRLAQKSIPTGLVYTQNEETLMEIGSDALYDMLVKRDWSSLKDTKVDRRYNKLGKIAQMLRDHDGACPGCHALTRASVRCILFVAYRLTSIQSRRAAGSCCGCARRSGVFSVICCAYRQACSHAKQMHSMNGHCDLNQYDDAWARAETSHRSRSWRPKRRLLAPPPWRDRAPVEPGVKAVSRSIRNRMMGMPAWHSEIDIGALYALGKSHHGEKRRGSKCLVCVAFSLVLHPTTRLAQYSHAVLECNGVGVLNGAVSCSERNPAVAYVREEHLRAILHAPCQRFLIHGCLTQHAYSIPPTRGPSTSNNINSIALSNGMVTILNPTTRKSPAMSRRAKPNLEQLLALRFI